MSEAAEASPAPFRASAFNPAAPACRALNDTCPNPAIAGGTVCKTHGGSTKHIKAAAKRRLAVAKADAKLRELEYEPVEDPVSELADIAGQAKALMEWAGARVADLQNALTYTDAHDVDQLKAEVGVYERAMDRTAKLVEACARLGLDERRVALEEGQAELAVAALRLAVQRAGLAEPQRQAVIDAWSVALPELEKANSEGGK